MALDIYLEGNETIFIPLEVQPNRLYMVVSFDPSYRRDRSSRNTAMVIQLLLGYGIRLFGNHQGLRLAKGECHVGGTEERGKEKRTSQQNATTEQTRQQ
jgi:hypothetical protein